MNSELFGFFEQNVSFLGYQKHVMDLSKQYVTDNFDFKVSAKSVYYNGYNALANALNIQTYPIYFQNANLPAVLQKYFLLSDANSKSKEIFNGENPLFGKAPYAKSLNTPNIQFY